MSTLLTLFGGLVAVLVVYAIGGIFRSLSPMLRAVLAGVIPLIGYFVLIVGRWPGLDVVAIHISVFLATALVLFAMYWWPLRLPVEKDHRFTLYAMLNTASIWATILAVCGIARPGRFAAAVRETGSSPVASLEFPDHHAYPARSLDRISAAVEEHGIEAVVTTAKDAVKLAGRLPAALAKRTYVLEAGISLPPELVSRLRNMIRALPSRGERP